MENQELDKLIDNVCGTLNISREICLLSHPYGTYRDARMIISKISQEQKIQGKEVAEAFNLRVVDQVATLAHNFRMKVLKNPDSVLNDRYKKVIRDLGVKIATKN